MPRDPEDPRSDEDMQREHEESLQWHKDNPPHERARENRDMPPTNKQRGYVFHFRLSPVNETRGAYSDAIRKHKEINP